MATPVVAPPDCDGEDPGTALRRSYRDAIESLPLSPRLGVLLQASGSRSEPLSPRSGAPISFAHYASDGSACISRGSTVPISVEVPEDVTLHQGSVERRSANAKIWTPHRLYLRPSGLLWTDPGGHSVLGVQKFVFFDYRTYKCVRQDKTPGTGFGFAVEQVDGKVHTFRVKHKAELSQWLGMIEATAEVTREKESAETWGFLYLNIYHCMRSKAIRAVNFVTKEVFHGGGVFHGGLDVYGKEYSFGGLPGNETVNDRTGVFTEMPRECQEHTFIRSVCVGMTKLKKHQVIGLVHHNLSKIWIARTYDLLSRNCVSFCRALADELSPGATGNFPDWIDSLARTGASLATSSKSLGDPLAGSMIVHEGEVEKQTTRLKRWRPVKLRLRAGCLDWSPGVMRDAGGGKAWGLAGVLSLDPRTFLEASVTGNSYFEAATTEHRIVLRCGSLAEAQKWVGMIKMVAKTIEAVPDFADKFLMDRVDKFEEAEDDDDDEPDSPRTGDVLDVRCSAGHRCDLRTQGTFSRTFRSISCAWCKRRLDKKESRWSCAPCSFDLCRSCSSNHMVF